MITPGRYLQLRRNHAGLSVLATASALAAHPAALHRATARQVNRMADRLHAAEADRDPLSPAQVRLIADVIPLSPGTYARLSAAHALGINAFLRICTGCGCTDFTACETEDGPCAWSLNQPDLCTACEDRQLDALIATAEQLHAQLAARHPARAA